jgi:hypothetical protein
LAELELFTARYADFEEAWGVPVRTSVGAPKFWSGPALEHIRRVSPYGLFDLEDDEEFARRYLARLDAQGSTALESRFRQVSDRHGGRPLVFLCFEDIRVTWCHRQLLAAWIERHMGLHVPELHRQGSLLGCHAPVPVRLGPSDA